MTTLIVNDKDKFDVGTSNEESIFDVLLLAQEQHWDPNCAIEKLIVNGEAIEPLEESTLMAIPAFEANIQISLSLPAARPLIQTISEAIEYLDRLQPGFEDIASQIRDQNSPAAYTEMKNGLDGLSTILQLVDHLCNMDSVPSSSKDEFKAFLDELGDKSKEMTDAQESADPTLIADILEYEFVDAAQDLKMYLEKLNTYLV